MLSSSSQIGQSGKEIGEASWAVTPLSYLPDPGRLIVLVSLRGDDRESPLYFTIFSDWAAGSGLPYSLYGHL